MLSFDIETTGLTRADRITAACVYNPEYGIRETFLFKDEHVSPVRFLKYLDEANVLCAFNGARFDIPFIQREFNIDPSRVTNWMSKLVDLYEMSWLVFKQGFSLNKVLTMNGIPVKTGCGREAITLAEEGRWNELGDYCMQDTIKTHAVTNLPIIKFPIYVEGKQIQLHNLSFQLVPYILEPRL